MLGAGAVGGTIGGLLAAAGHEVVLSARGAHLEALRADGLRLATPGGVLTPPVTASAVGELALRTGDVLVLATKVQDAATLLAALDAPADVPVVCAQNGLAGDRSALRRFARVYGVCVMLPALHLEPGQVAAFGTPQAGSLDLGRYPHGLDDTAEQVAEDLRGSGFQSTTRAEILPWKRAKLLRNLGNSVETLGGHGESGYAGPGPAAAELSHRARLEGEAVFEGAAMAWTSDEEWVAYRGRSVQIGDVEGLARGGGSSWQSAARGLGSIEADYLNGEIVLLGRTHGVPTPVNALLQREANALVRRGDPPGSVDLAGLLARL